MPHKCLNRFGVYTGCIKHCRVSMTAAMRRKIAYPQFLNRSLINPIEAFSVHNATCIVGKEKITLAVIVQPLDERQCFVGNRYDPNTFWRFGLTERHKTCLNPGRCMGDMNAGIDVVDVCMPQRQKLIFPHAGVDQNTDNIAVFQTAGILFDNSNFIQRKRVFDPFFLHLGKLPATADIPHDHVVDSRFLQHSIQDAFDLFHHAPAVVLDQHVVDQCLDMHGLDIGDGTTNWQTYAECSLHFRSYGTYETCATGVLMVCDDGLGVETGKQIIQRTMWNRKRFIKDENNYDWENPKKRPMSKSPVKLHSGYQHVYLAERGEVMSVLKTAAAEQKIKEYYRKHLNLTENKDWRGRFLEDHPDRYYINLQNDLLYLAVIVKHLKERGEGTSEIRHHIILREKHENLACLYGDLDLRVLTASEEHLSCLMN